MSSSTTYRLAKPEDSPALESLISATADSGRIGFTDEYQVDLLDFHRTLAEEFHAVVAERDGKLVGMLFGEGCWVQYAGQLKPGVYISHLRVHPDYQRQGIARGLSDWGLDYITDLFDSDLVLYGAIMAGNASLRLADQYGFQITEPIQGGIIPMRRRPPAALPNVEVRLAKRSELSVIAEEMNAFYQEHNLWSPVSVDILEEFLSQEVNNARPNQLHIAVRDGRIVAGLSLSDRTKLVRMRLSRSSVPVRLLGKLLGVLPASGVLEALTVRRVWFRSDDLMAGRYLWQSLRFQLRELGNCMGIAYDPRDRLAKLFQVPVWLPMFKARYLIRVPSPLETDRLTYCLAGP